MIKVAAPFADVIGDPVAQSKSPLIHKFWLEKLDISGDYLAEHVRAPALADYISRRRANVDWRGCNVTTPHKITVMSHMTALTKAASNIGAVNTVVCGSDGNLTGHNTDTLGIQSALRTIDLTDAHVTMVGAGGAARAACHALQSLGAGHITVMNRTRAKAQAMLQDFTIASDTAGLDHRPRGRLFINASTLGMHGQPALNVPLGDMESGAVVFDMVYAPLRTALLAAADANGLEQVDGLDMLIGQADSAFTLFFGKGPPREDDADLRKILVA